MRIKITTIVLVTMILSVAAVFAGGRQEGKSSMDSADKDSPVESGGNPVSPDWLVENTDEHITVIDSGSHSITIQKPVGTVIAMGMAVFPSIRAIGAEEMVIGTVGVSEYGGDILYPYMSTLPLVADQSGPGASLDYELIVELDPDVVFCLSAFWPEVNERLSSTGIPVVQLDFASLQDISILGTILDKEDQAQEYVSWIENKVGFVEERTRPLPEDEKPEVFLYYGGNYGMSPPPPYGTYGKANDLGNKTISIAGGRSISSGIAGEWITVDPEWLIERDPEVIIREYYIMTEEPYLGFDVTEDEKAKEMLSGIVSMPAFELSAAVKNGDVHMIYGDLISDSWFLGLQYMAKWFHSDLFEDLDPMAVQQEFMTKFLRLDYNVYEQGVFSCSVE